MKKKIIIRVSRQKLIAVALGALAFVVAGIFIISKTVSLFSFTSVLGLTIGGASLLFFGVCFLFAIIRLFDQRPGLILTEEGFIDNSGFIGNPFIKWKEIKNIESLKIMHQQFISIRLIDPDNLIDQTGGIRKLLMKLNYKFYGSPVHISANGLQYKFEGLWELFYTTWQTSKG